MGRRRGASENHVMRNTYRLLLIGAALLAAASSATAAMRTPGPMPHGPPNITPPVVCKVLPRYGSDFCTAPPYASVGRACTCDGPKGLRTRQGVVSWR
jgi:hypothetical protein